MIVKKSEKFKLKELVKKFNKKSSKYKLYYYSSYGNYFIIDENCFFGRRIIKINYNDDEFSPRCGSNIYLEDYNNKIIWKKIKESIIEFEDIFKIEVEIILD